MTVVELSNKVGVDKAIISKILHRKLAPSKIMMMKIAKIFGCDSRVIFPDGYSHWIPGKFKNEVDELDEMHFFAPQAHPKNLAN